MEVRWFHNDEDEKRVKKLRSLHLRVFQMGQSVAEKVRFERMVES
jgi:hypothetical protein